MSLDDILIGSEGSEKLHLADVIADNTAGPATQVESVEMKRMLVHENRVAGVSLLRDSGLLDQLLPDLASQIAAQPAAWDRTLAILRQFQTPTFSMALAALFREVYAAVGLDAVRGALGRWKLANEESEGALRLLREESLIRQAEARPWPEIQRLLVAPRAEELVSYVDAVAAALGEGLSGVAFCRQKLALPAAALNPHPLITGEDLKRLGIALGRLTAKSWRPCATRSSRGRSLRRKRP